MRNNHIPILATFLLTLILTGCAVAGGIFKAGMIWWILLVTVVIFGVIYLISRGGKK